MRARIGKMSEVKLNKQQLEAVRHKTGPLLIIAGAGTGKTTVITERIKYLILNKLAKPEEVLALTFTEKAAREMEERVDLAMPYGYTQMWISTFHSFCDKILRREALHIGLDPKYKLTTEAEAIQLVRSNLFKFDLDYFRPLGNPNKFIVGMLQHFSRLQDESVTPSEYLQWSKKLKNLDKIEIKKFRELAEAYRTYDELKIKEGYFDYGDLITKTLLLFRQRKNILQTYRNQFKYLLVDEFQDTNYAQNELVKMLANKDQNVTVVGDDDQSIYRFRGSSVSNIIQFRKSFPKTKIVVLTYNYRSTQEILDRSYDLIQHNNPDRLEVVEKVNKKLIAEVDDPTSRKASRGEEIIFLHTDRVENEAESVVSEIKKLSKNYDFRDFAILVRANNHAEAFVRALSRQGIPHQFLGPGRLFKQPEIIDLVAYLKVLYNFEDAVAFYRLLSIDQFEIPIREIITLGNKARRSNISLFEAAEKEDAPEKIRNLTTLINRHLKLIKKETAGQLLYLFLQETGLLKKLLTPDSPTAEKAAVNISKLFDKLKSYETDHEDATVSAVVDWINLSAELGESPLAADSDWTNVNAVNLLTVHSAKGLEFPVVFLVNLVAQRFPSSERREQIPIPDQLIKEILPTGDFHLEEERRLFYVGMTRAKEKLYLTAADYYGEGKREKKLSPFIHEALGKEVGSSFAIASEDKQLSFTDFETKSKPFEVSTKEGELHINYLSYSQIETFRVCPLHYKLKYIYKIPTPQLAAQSFGTSMHLALKDFYASEKDKSLKNFLRLLKQDWISDGYQTKTHEEKMFKKGLMYLTDYYKNQFDPKTKSVMFEQVFTLPINPSLRIGGKIDRVDLLPDGKIEIIDYKTGANIPTQREIDKDLQMTFYALAATSLTEFPFGKKPEEIKLTFYYFDSGKYISTVRTKEDLDKAKLEIIKYRDEIEHSNFTCSGSILCNNCEYKLLCSVDH